MHSLFDMARRKVAHAERSEEGWEAALDFIHVLLRTARRMIVEESHPMLTHLERAVAAAEKQDAPRVLHQLRLAEIELP